MYFPQPGSGIVLMAHLPPGSSYKEHFMPIFKYVFAKTGLRNEHNLAIMKYISALHSGVLKAYYRSPIIIKEWSVKPLMEPVNFINFIRVLVMDMVELP